MFVTMYLIGLNIIFFFALSTLIESHHKEEINKVHSLINEINHLQKLVYNKDHGGRKLVTTTAGVV